MMKRFISWLFSVRGLKSVIFAVACLGTLVAAFYIIENWRGEKAWAAAKADLKARGVPITYDEILPTPPPEDQNFMMAPFWLKRWSGETYEKIPTKTAARLYDKAVQMNMEAWRKSKDYVMPPSPQSFLGSWQTQELPDLPALRDYFIRAGHLPDSAANGNPAAAIFKMTETWDAEISELKEASATRPLSYLPLDWRKGYRLANPLFNLNRILCQNLVLRSHCALILAQEKEALAGYDIIERLADTSLAAPTTVVGLLLGSSIDTFSLAVIWHGLARQAWSESSLEYLETVLARKDYRAAWHRAMLLDQVGFAEMIEDFCSQYEGPPSDLVAMFENSGQRMFGLRGCWWSYFPKGWWRQNQVSYVNLMRPVANAEIPWSALLKVTEDERLFTVSKNSYSFLTRIGATFLESAGKNTVHTAASLGLARLALALERHRQRAGVYPEALDALHEYFPQGMPEDPFVDRPFRYKLVNDIPKLWSVGMNLEDEGGVIGFSGKRLDLSKGDIVWTYATSALPSGND